MWTVRSKYPLNMSRTSLLFPFLFWGGGRYFHYDRKLVGILGVKKNQKNMGVGGGTPRDNEFCDFGVFRAIFLRKIAKIAPVFFHRNFFRWKNAVTKKCSLPFSKENERRFWKWYRIFFQIKSLGSYDVTKWRFFRIFCYFFH